MAGMRGCKEWHHVSALAPINAWGFDMTTFIIPGDEQEINGSKQNGKEPHGN
jgi:hypothetical protein